VLLTRVEPRSLLARLGLATGDRIREVAGQPLASLDDAAAVYAVVARASKVDVLFDRDGAPRILRVRVSR
jgi:hypothetical protein